MRILTEKIFENFDDAKKFAEKNKVTSIIERPEKYTITEYQISGCQSVCSLNGYYIKGSDGFYRFPVEIVKYKYKYVVQCEK